MINHLNNKLELAQNLESWILTNQANSISHMLTSESNFSKYSQKYVFFLSHMTACTNYVAIIMASFHTVLEITPCSKLKINIQQLQRKAKG